MKLRELTCKNCSNPLDESNVDSVENVLRCDNCQSEFPLKEQHIESLENESEESPSTDAHTYTVAQPDRFSVSESGGERTYTMSSFSSSLINILFRMLFATVFSFVLSVLLFRGLGWEQVFLPAAGVAAVFFFSIPLLSMGGFDRYLTATSEHLVHGRSFLFFPLFQTSFPVQDINSIFVRKKEGGEDFEVCIKTSYGEEQNVLDVPSRDEAIFLEQDLEHYYDLDSVEEGLEYGLEESEPTSAVAGTVTETSPAKSLLERDIFPPIPTETRGTGTVVKSQSAGWWTLVITGILTILLIPAGAGILYLFSGGEGQSFWLPVIMGSLFLAGGLGCLYYAYTLWRTLSTLEHGELVCSEWPLELGKTVEVEYNRDTERGTVVLNGVTATLTCEEKVRYQSGTDTRTARREVYNETVLDVDRSGRDTSSIREEFELPVPKNAMQTLHAYRNKVKWELEVDLELENVPAQDSHFSLLIVPHTGDAQ